MCFTLNVYLQSYKNMFQLVNWKHHLDIMHITSNSFQPWISRDAEPRNMEGGLQWTSASTDFGIHRGPRTNPPWPAGDDHSMMIKVGEHTPERSCSSVYFKWLQIWHLFPSLSKILQNPILFYIGIMCNFLYSDNWVENLNENYIISTVVFLVSYNQSWYEVSLTLSREDVIVMYIRNVWDSETEREGFSFRLG